MRKFRCWAMRELSPADRFRALSREYELSDVLAVYGWQQVQDDIETAQMLDDRKCGKWRRKNCAKRRKSGQLNWRSYRYCCCRRSDDERNAFREVRAGTGDEAALFAGDLFRMYSRYASAWRRWRSSMSEASMAVIKRSSPKSAATACYGRLKFESGGHRDFWRCSGDRVTGHIIPPACTVAVMPELPEAELY